MVEATTTSGNTKTTASADTLLLHPQLEDYAVQIHAAIEKHIQNGVPAHEICHQLFVNIIKALETPMAMPESSGTAPKAVSDGPLNYSINAASQTTKNVATSQPGGDEDDSIGVLVTNKPMARLSWPSWNDVGNAFKDVGTKIKDTADNVGNGIRSAAETTGTFIKENGRELVNNAAKVAQGMEHASETGADGSVPNGPNMGGGTRTEEDNE